MRSGIVVARAVSFPPRTCGSDGNRLSNRDRHLSAERRRECGARAAERYVGHLQTGELKKPRGGQVRALPGAGGRVAHWSGIFFRYSISSGIDFTGTDGCAEMMLLVRIMLLTGCN